MNLDILRGLPGAGLVEKGLADHARGDRTPEACLVEMASPRLAQAGLLPAPIFGADSEHTLYRLLIRAHPGRDAYPIYNSLCRLLVSFERALDHRLRRRAQPAASAATP